MSVIAEKPSVGRKKKAVPSDYVSVKVARDVYVNAKIVAALEGKEIAQVLSDTAREPLAKRAEEGFRAANPLKPKGGPK